MKSIEVDDLIPVEAFLWEIPRERFPGMRVPARIFALPEMLPSLLGDRTLVQLVNVTCLPGIQQAAFVMPDGHEGYGFPIGGVAATEHPHGVISPGGIGYDINCGVRLLTSELIFKDIVNTLPALAASLNRWVPSGIGKGGSLKLGIPEIDKVLRKGAGWAIRNGYGSQDDLENIESHGCLQEADPSQVSLKAKQRGHDQLGTIGAGNHFVEVDRVGEIFDKTVGRSFGLSEDQIVILIHTGSRGLGHQIATDHIRTMMSAMQKYNIQLPDRELACVPFDSPEGQSYFRAMACAANFAWCNREVITWEIRNAWQEVLGTKGGELNLLYDVAHNIAKIEEYEVDGTRKKLIVHRKGATRSFGPGFPELPEAFRDIGQPVMIPGSMGTESYVLCGTTRSQELSFGSSCHGAGRRLSRRAAKKQVDALQLIKELKDRGIHVQAGSYRGVAEEAPLAYKDVNLVVETVHRAGIAKKVARLKPLAVIKG